MFRLDLYIRKIIDFLIKSISLMYCLWKSSLSFMIFNISWVIHGRCFRPISLLERRLDGAISSKRRSIFFIKNVVHSSVFLLWKCLSQSILSSFSWNSLLLKCLKFLPYLRWLFGVFEAVKKLEILQNWAKWSDMEAVMLPPWELFQSH